MSSELEQGAWGPNIAVDNLPGIPNRNVYIYNNLIANPAPAQTQYSHFDIYNPIARPDGFQNLPATIVTDENLVIAGNLIWNGPSDFPLGVEDTQGGPPGAYAGPRQTMFLPVVRIN